MPAEQAASYCGERTVGAFLQKSGKTRYPPPRVAEGHRRLWLKDDLDQAIFPPKEFGVTARPRRGFVTMTLKLPRYVIAKRLAHSHHRILFQCGQRGIGNLGCENLK